MTSQSKSPEENKAMSLSGIGITTIDLTKPPKRLLDVLEEIAPEGEKVKLEDFLGQDIVFHTLRVFEGEYGVAAFVVFTDRNGVLFNTIVGQQVLLAKLLTVAQHLPVTATIIKQEGGKYGGYYDFE